jgi:glyoxylase-like metal-dependent hydrolase (beta-lactamase superfamily II)
MPFFDRITTPFFDRLAAAGVAPDDIDYVLCTHMHLDQVSWNTRWNGDSWIPTFPKAQYLFGRIEWDHWHHEVEVAQTPVAAEMRATLNDSVKLILDVGLHQFVETDHRIDEEVSLFPTPGHTPGHVSVAISSKGQQAIIADDAMHHPIQIADAGVGCNFDSDMSLAEATRRSFIADNTGRDVLVFGMHFARPSGGRIVKEESSFRFVPGPLTIN